MVTEPTLPHDAWLEKCRQFRLANEPPDVVSLTLTWGGPGTGVGYAGGLEDHVAAYMLETALRKLRTSMVTKAVAADYERWQAAIPAAIGRHPPTPAELAEYADLGQAEKLEDFTCHTCDAKAACPSAWDLYNTGGDCLEEK